MELKRLLTRFAVAGLLMVAAAVLYLVATAPAAKVGPPASAPEVVTATSPSSPRTPARPAPAPEVPAGGRNAASAATPVPSPDPKRPDQPPPPTPPPAARARKPTDDDVVEISALAIVAARLYPDLATAQDFPQRAIESECRRRGIGAPAFEAAVESISADESRAEGIRQRINAQVGQLLAAKVRVEPPRLPGPELRQRLGAG